MVAPGEAAISSVRAETTRTDAEWQGESDTDRQLTRKLKTFCVQRSSEPTSCRTSSRYLSAALTREVFIRKSQTLVASGRGRTLASVITINLKKNNNKKAENVMESWEVISSQHSVKTLEMWKIRLLVWEALGKIFKQMVRFCLKVG